MGQPWHQLGKGALAELVRMILVFSIAAVNSTSMSSLSPGAIVCDVTVAGDLGIRRLLRLQ